MDCTDDVVESSSESEESEDDPDEDGCRAGSRVMDMGLLHDLSQNFCCKKCAESLVKKTASERSSWVDEFSVELIALLGDDVCAAGTINTLKASFCRRKAWASVNAGSPNQSAKKMCVSIVKEWRCGLASCFMWKCQGPPGRSHTFLHNTSKRIPSPPAPVPADGEAGASSEPKPKRMRVCELEVNAKAAIAMVSIGRGGADLTKVAAHFGLPLASSFHQRSYAQCEETIGHAMIAVADESQREACVTSAVSARRHQASYASRGVALPIGTMVTYEGRELVNVAAGFDGGWQRRAVGMCQYNSRSGHALMICPDTQLILDREVKRAQCAKCDAW